LSEEKKLNKEQKEAVEHGDGPLLIIAGAGTGKTTVITERIKHLIASERAKPAEILALTFTEKAAREMEERVDVAMPYGYFDMWIMTFHGFCDRVMRAEALQIGLPTRFRLMGEAEATRLVRDNLFEFDLEYFRPLGNPNKFIGGLLQHFGRLQDEDISPTEYISWAKTRKLKNSKLQNKEEQIENIKWLELAGAYRKYDELKVREGAMDFGDLITKTLQLFRDRGNVLRNYRERFKYVLVDEFQDTNYAQNELAMMLAGEAANITVCGDDDQSVYRFRGAAVSNILQFRKLYPKAKVVTLNKNYRSTQEILDKAYSLVQHNNPDRLEVVENVDKKLVSQVSGNGEPVGFIHVGRVENEAEEVAEVIKRLSSEERYRWADFAILVRANNHAEAFGRALGRHSIPYQFLGPGRLFKQGEVVDLVSYLRVLADLEDSVSFYRLLSIEELGVDQRETARLGSYAKKKNISLFEAAEEIGGKEVSDLVKLVHKHLKLLPRETAGQILYYFLEETGLLTRLLDPKSVEAEKRAANISKFFDKLKTYEVEHEDASVVAVVDWIELASEVGESPLAADTDWNRVNAVNILTVHSSKGLEFPVVFLVNLVNGRFPPYERAEQIPIPDELIKETLPGGDYHKQEERRLFYVGMTRAERRLFFTASDYYGEGKRVMRLSPFIFEALGEEAVAGEQTADYSKQQSLLGYEEAVVSSPKAVGKVHIDYLSYSQVQSFEVCPLHYKLQYLVRVPMRPTSALSLGSSVHSTLKDFYLAAKASEKVSEKKLVSLLEENWIDEGYKSKKHERKAWGRARGLIVEYFRREFDAKRLPALVEQKFVVPLPYKKGEKRLKIGGVIDRVDILENGDIEIIDYKTGESVPSQSEVDKNEQLSFYGLAATRIMEEPFGKDVGQIKLSLYFFEEQKKITTVRTREQLEKMIERIYDVRRQIEESDFACSGGYLCRNCEYKLFCSGD